MAKKEKLPIVLSEIEPEDKLKYEVAEELGLLDKVLTEGVAFSDIERNGKNRRFNYKEKTAAEIVA